MKGQGRFFNNATFWLKSLYINQIRVNCHFSPYGLVTFATLVQNTNFLHLDPCGFSFIAILVKK
ncbi:hypothetical protein Hanom_Chr17g01529511 [Helianthus anomalus]